MNSDAKHFGKTRQPFYGCIELEIGGKKIIQSHFEKYYINSTIQKRVKLQCLKPVRDYVIHTPNIILVILHSNMCIQQALMAMEK